MSILPEERIENVKASLFNYLNSNFTLVPIEFEGIHFEEKDTDEWVSVDMEHSEIDYQRQVADGKMGAKLLVSIGAVIKLKKDKVENGNYLRRHRIRDELTHLFRVPRAVTVKDYYSSPSSPVDIGILQTFEIEDQYLGYSMTDSLYAHSITCRMFYHQIWEQ